MNKTERARINKRLDDLAELVLQAQDEIYDLNQQLNTPEYVSVVYVRPGDSTNLLKRSAFAYINGVGDTLQVGDRVVAPTVYNPFAEAIVVSLSRIQDDGYAGPFKTITEVIWP